MTDAAAAISIAVIIPCYNEEVAISHVVAGFRAALPGAAIHVFDNNSKDRTIAVAQEAGAFVHRVSAQGKGHVVRRMFADVEADIYVLVDGDDTYDPKSAPRMIDKLIAEQLDMVVGTRVSDEKTAYRPGHRFGNAMLTGMVALIFGQAFTDILSGYRIFSRRFAKSFPATSGGFEIETELTVHALQLVMPCGEVETPYGSRREGSLSKLNTYRDGWRILMTIQQLLRFEMPLRFFSIVAGVLAGTSILLGIPLLIEFIESGLVPRVPTAILATGLMLIAALSLASGFILDNVTRGRRELRHLFYLRNPGPLADRRKERRPDAQ
ncbi:glycosyltransferase involved in cell wall biosynthesis [Dongia mobilis]|uniref:Glycosyltransferase involved in cell wall biosynthesis n=1 Tax=Dongia mobilis TaxID=578943 RepID=A0A4R6WSR7_9PROT|nr:glycosyltransferase family 2 protein [Dongia mobilis]TDQ83058.1 glycosyltransferase involved in cell wall biosynthesis [Dongia mobilis]